VHSNETNECATLHILMHTLLFRHYIVAGAVLVFVIVVDGRASSDAACHAGGPGSIPGRGQTYV
jgi:hypothetical protein